MIYSYSKSRFACSVSFRFAEPGFLKPLLQITGSVCQLSFTVQLYDAVCKINHFDLTLQSDLLAHDVTDQNVFSIDIDAAHIFTDNCVFRILVYRCKAHSLRLLYLTSFKCSFTSVSARDRRILPFWKSDTPSRICFAASAIPAFSSLSAISSSSAA